MKHSQIVNASTANGIAEGRITAFIEPVKPQPQFYMEYNGFEFGMHWFKDCHSMGHHPKIAPNRHQLISPFQIGQEIYFREPYRVYLNENDQYDEVVEYAANGNCEPLYLSDGDGFQMFNKDGSEKMIPWKLCGKSAARLFADIVDVKCVRVQDIKQEMAKELITLPMPHRPSSEGCKPHADNSLKRDCYCCALMVDFKRKFGKSWDNNIFVWVNKFKLKTT